VPYWKDAGSPVNKGDNDTTAGGKSGLYQYIGGQGQSLIRLLIGASVSAFERCVLDPQCAARTVQGYMARFRKVSS
jgi:hypothetical protein